MKKSIFITGGSGVGKTTISHALRAAGYEAHDIEEIPGLFELTDKQTREILPLESHDNLDIEHVKRIEWVCDVEKLGTLIAGQKSDVAFYCGVATNIAELPPLFTYTVLLKASEAAVRERLATRTTSDFGRNSEVREWVMQRTQKLETELIAATNPAVVYAESSPEEAAQQIIALLS